MPQHSTGPYQNDPPTLPVPDIHDGPTESQTGSTDEDAQRHTASQTRAFNDSNGLRKWLAKCCNGAKN